MECPPSYNALFSFALYTLYFMFVWLQMLNIQVHADNFIIHMDIAAMPKPFSHHHAWYSATVQSVISDQLVSSKLVYSYTHAIQGFCATLSPQELEAMKTRPGFISVTKDSAVKMDTTHSFEFIGLKPSSGAWPMTNFGKDMIIGLIDTGVWPESESFNDVGMTAAPSRWRGECESGYMFDSSLCNKKLIGARFFNRGLIAQYPNASITMNSTRDTDGHGTHTSSTAAGNFVHGASYFGYARGTARGMAPRAHVAMYKALWEQGSYSSDIIAAIDQAISDGVDVISLSLGTDGVELYDDPIAIATFSASQKNVFVSTSAGNEGPYYRTLHNGTPWVLTVAAGTIDREFGATLTLGNGVSIPGSSLYPRNPLSSQIPIVFMGKCDNLKQLVKVGKKIVVCEDKNDSLSTQFDNVSKAKVLGGVFITSLTDVQFFLTSSFPAIILKYSSSHNNSVTLIKDYINSDTGKAKASIEFKKTFLGTEPAPSVTSYSSRGPSYSCPFVLKPDILAPGDLVLASWTLNTSVTQVGPNDLLFSKFNIISGTSMACPHAAGVAALIKAAHPEWSPAAIRSALMTCSDFLDNTGGLIKDAGDKSRVATPLAIGSGHVNPNKALDPGLVYDATSQDYVNLLCAMNYTDKQIQIITKTSSNDCSAPSMDLNYPSFIAFFNPNATKSKAVREFERTVTNVGAARSIYMAKVTMMEGFRVSVRPEKLVFKEEKKKKRFVVRIERLNTESKRVVETGYLRWEEISGGGHVVRSPIVVTSLTLT